MIYIQMKIYLNIDNLEQTQINTQKCEICNMDAEYYW